MQIVLAALLPRPCLVFIPKLVGWCRITIVGYTFFHIEEGFVVVDRILPAKMNKG